MRLGCQLILGRTADRLQARGVASFRELPHVWELLDGLGNFAHVRVQLFGGQENPGKDGRTERGVARLNGQLVQARARERPSQGRHPQTTGV